MRPTIDILIAGILLLTLGACVDVRKLALGLAQKDQSATIHKNQNAGGNIQDVTINIVGDEVLFSGACMLGLAFFGWWYAAYGRKVNADSTGDIVRGIEMFKIRLERELDIKPSLEQSPEEAKLRSMYENILQILETSNNYHQGTKTRAIVRKIRGKPEKSKKSESLE
jgi:hypothetical protein